MKKIYYTLILIIALVSTIQYCTPTGGKHNTNQAYHNTMYVYLDSIQATLTSLAHQASTMQPLAALQQQLLQARLYYKHIEPILEYYYQGFTKRLNGPALPDVKLDDNQVWPPAGFQVLEQYLYNPYNNSTGKLLIQEIKILQTDLKFCKADFASITVLPAHLPELLQHTCIRLATIGITGADAPLSKLSIPEAAATVLSIQQLSAIAAVPYNPIFLHATAYLTAHASFDDFDRLTYISKYLIPISNHIAAYIPITISITNKPFVGTLQQLLQHSSYNADAYLAYSNGISNSYKVQLGKKLFYETKLSQLNNISCATCHNPKLYFTDGLTKAKNFVHGGSLARNTPTLLYAALQNNQFYDMRSPYLEDQVHQVIINANEFNFSTHNIAKLCTTDTAYTALFAKAFTLKDTISSYQIRNAISSYVRTLMPFNSAFDQYWQGNATALSVQQQQGFNLFAGKAKCATCHFIPLFNGTVPPWYNKTENEIIGVPSTIQWTNATIDPDAGRYNYNQLQELQYAFKTPTVRNVARTAPYMHNGVYNTLQEVVQFYHKGGGVGIGITLPYQSLPFDSLQLNQAEQLAIVSFMQSLTDSIP